MRLDEAFLHEEPVVNEDELGLYLGRRLVLRRLVLFRHALHGLRTRTLLGKVA
jgi:hypothetical protein